MKSLRHVVLCLVISVLCRAAANGEDAQPQYPLPEKLVHHGDTSFYIQKATKFLEQAPEHPLAARVAYELMMVAAVKDNGKLAKEMRQKLILGHIKSLHGLFLLRSIEKEDDYRKLLMAAAKSNRGNLSGEFAKKFTLAVKGGLSRFKKKLLSDDGFALLAALIARDAGEEKLEKALSIDALSKTDLAEDLRQLGEVALKQQGSSSEKLLKLHAIEDSETARLFVSYFMSLVPEDARSRPEVRHVFVVNHLRRAAFQEALALLREGGKEAEASRDAFLQAWCHASLGERDEALACIGRLSGGEDDAWAAAGRDLGRQLENLDRNLGLYADALLKAVQEIKKGIASLKLSATFGLRDSDKEVGIYLGVRPKGDLLEFHLLENGTHALAYRTSAAESLVYAEGEPAILRFGKSGPVPIPQLNLREVSDGGITLNAKVTMGSSVDGAAAANRPLLDSPLLNTKEGLLKLFKRWTTHGAFPSNVSSVENGTKFRWLFPTPDEPKFAHAEYTVTPSGKIHDIQYRKFKCASIRYSSEESFELSPPAWPELKTVTKQELDPSLMLKLMGMLMEKFSTTKSEL